MYRSTCPFCGCDPYHYVDNGVGMEAVAVTCCELGIRLFDVRDDSSDEVTITRDELRWFADVFRAMRTLGMTPEGMP